MDRKNKILSLIAPAYNESGNIEALALGVSKAMESQGIPYELIVVDDGSKDTTWSELQGISKQDSRVKGIRFSRNFGKEAAMLAGLEAAEGGCAVIIDADLQFPPETAAQMYDEWLSGADVVEGKKRTRGKVGFVYRIFTKIFYGILKLMSGIDLGTASDFKLLDRAAIEAVLSMGERQTFFRAMSGWTGFKTTDVYFDVAPRFSGKTKFTPVKLIKMALSSIAAYTSAPLQIISILGTLSFLGSVITGLFALLYDFSNSHTAYFMGATAIMLLISGFLMWALGVVGFYIARVYDEVKGRPRYIISEWTHVIEAENMGGSTDI